MSVTYEPTRGGIHVSRRLCLLLPLTTVGMLGCDLASLERALPTANPDMASASMNADLAVAADMAPPSQPIDMASFTPSPDLSVPQSLASDDCPDPAGCYAVGDPRAGAAEVYYRESMYVTADCSGTEYAAEQADPWDGRGLLGNTQIDLDRSLFQSFRNGAGLCTKDGFPYAGWWFYKVYRAQADTGCNCAMCNTCVAGTCVPLTGQYADGERCSPWPCTSQHDHTSDICQGGACGPGGGEVCPGNGTCQAATGECVGGS